jgi:hypothetical protein
MPGWLVVIYKALGGGWQVGGDSNEVDDEGAAHADNCGACCDHRRAAG